MNKTIFFVLIIFLFLICPTQAKKVGIEDYGEEDPPEPLGNYEDYIEIIGDGHIHSVYSGGASSVHDCAQKAWERDLDWIFITDYDTISAKQKCTEETNETFICGLGEEIQVIEGSPPEVTNEIIAWGINSVVDGQTDANYTVGDIIDEIHVQGGLAYLPHPCAPENDDNYDYFGIYDDFDAMSIYHGYAGFNNDPLIPQLKMDEYALEKWDEYLTNGFRKTAVGESDCKNADNTPDYGYVDGMRGAIGYPRNYIYTKEFSVRGIMEAVRHGRCYITDGPIMNFTIDGYIIGDTIYSDTIETLNISISGIAIETSNVRIISNGGGVIYSEWVSPGSFLVSCSYIASNDAYFRAEIRTNNSQTFPDPFKGETNISFSNPIYFDLSPYEENPNPPNNLEAWVSGNDIVLNWTSSNSSDVMHYNIYKSTTLNGFDFTYPYALTSKTMWVDKGAGEGDYNNYFYIVRAVDRKLYNDSNLVKVGKHVKYLNQGWNLVSIPFNLSKTDPGDVLQTINDTCIIAQYYNSSDSLDHWKDTKVGDLTEILDSMGLWLYLNASDVLITAGRVPQFTAINLNEGWNLVGYPSFTNRSLEDALSGLEFWESLQFFDSGDITGDYWKHNNKKKPQHLNDLDEMVIGRGYWLYVNQNCIWIVTT